MAASVIVASVQDDGHVMNPFRAWEPSIQYDRQRIQFRAMIDTNRHDTH